MLNEIKWAWQRVVRGYDDRIHWGFDTYFTQMIPALKEFCQNELNQEHIHLNPEQKEIFTKTLELIAAYQSPTTYERDGKTIHSWLDEDKKLAELAEYWGKNINHYWD